jgi:uncharacterized membrane protein required for colicin V production
MSPPILFYFLENFHNMVAQKNWISFSFLVVNLKNMENFAELLKPKKLKKKKIMVGTWANQYGQLIKHIHFL